MKRKTEAKRRLFVDMDGTLAEFRTSAAFSDLYREGYFRTLKPNSLLVDKVQQCAFQPHMEVFILSAYLEDSPYALAEKKAWAAKHLPGVKTIFTPCGSCKAEAVRLQTGSKVTENDVLLDDYSENLLSWQKCGGKALKALNGVNGTCTSEYTGRRIDIFDAKELELLDRL